MNARQLKKIGVPEDCVKDAIVCIQTAKREHDCRNIKGIVSLVAAPEKYLTDRAYADLA